MKKVQMKKSMLIMLIVLVGLTGGSLGAFASSGIELIQAYLNHDIKFKVNGVDWTPRDSDGIQLAPIILNGSSYLPARAISEAVGASVYWDNATSTILINSTPVVPPSAGVPYKEAPAALPADSLISFPSNFVTDAQLSNMKAEAVSVIRMYADALTTGSTTAFHNYVATRVHEKIGTAGVDGRQLSEFDFSKRVQNEIASNDPLTVLSYAGDVYNVTSSSLKVSQATKDASGATFAFNYYPYNWYATNGVAVYFSFSRLDDGSYVLSSVSLV